MLISVAIAALLIATGTFVVNTGNAIRAHFNNAYSVWWVADMVIEHMDANTATGQKAGMNYETTISPASLRGVGHRHLRNCNQEFRLTGMPIQTNSEHSTQMALRHLP